MPTGRTCARARPPSTVPRSRTCSAASGCRPSHDSTARLRADPPARVADVGCGEGWSTIAIARAYPKAQVVGVDLDGPSIEAARRNASEAGSTARVEFRTRRRGAARRMGPYDAAIIIEAVHDMANPVPVLRAIRDALAAGRFAHRRRRAGGGGVRARRATTSSASCTAGASRPACPTDVRDHPAWRPAPSCVRTRFAATRRRLASRRSRSCRSRTTSSASTACSG